MTSLPTRFLAILSMLALADSAGADTLGDVKAAVGKLSAHQTVRATFGTDQLVKSAGRFSNATTTRQSTAEVAHDQTGVTINIPQSLVDRAAQERGPTEGHEDTARNLIGALRSIEIVEALDFRAPLLRLLENAEMLAEKPAPFRGRPSRLVTLKLNRPVEKEAGSIRLGSVKSEDQMTVWIGSDNLPLAAERVNKTTGGFMMIKATHTSRSSYVFGYTGDRMVVARLETRDTGSGMGQKVERTSVQTLTLR